MFILRRIPHDGVQTNHIMGDDYSIIGRGENAELFRSAFKQHFKKNHIADNDPSSDPDTKNCYAFISYSDWGMLPLFRDHKNFIMTGDGQTFANVSYK